MFAARRLLSTLVAALTAGALTAGCDTVQHAAVTKEQAVERVVARAEEAFAQLPPGASLKIRSTEPDMPCDDGPAGRTFVETGYTVEYPDAWPVEQSMATLSAYWQRSGYKTIRDDRGSDKLPEIVVEHPDDGFRIGYLLTHRDNGRIDAYLTSSSPCL